MAPVSDMKDSPSIDQYMRLKGSANAVAEEGGPYNPCPALTTPGDPLPCRLLGGGDGKMSVAIGRIAAAGLPLREGRIRCHWEER